MITKCTVMAVAMALLNVIAAVFLYDNLMVLFFVCLLVISTGMGILYFLLVKPVEEMKTKAEETAKEASQKENIRSEFVANVSHELKTPLTSISGFIETLQAGAVEDPATRDRFIEIIAIETARLKRLIDDILTLSDIESSMNLSRSNFNCHRVIDEIFEVLSPIASERNITMINDTNEYLYFDGNEDKFRQMIMNLVENAIKYGVDDGHVWVRDNSEDEKLILSVKDDGIGIDNEDLERIAERFYRVDKSRSRKIGGTGLGLSIVKHTAALFNGELKVKSEIGKGSTFSIVIHKNN